ncbi:MAG: hypothetical protein I3273_05040 [Candidatus Moeniiplasma glomeromycotorum]|nr:hypothetical protein [Candidatus Moeniiplasma glomeromycotorum]MCE8167908.1 hypothetical protein [Candidatus Moeniiplasma glomeromycotorum]MCE8169458.1 hypothetical protein [Candidatus Moeniiplasma glomeromycotorum]
MLNLKIKYQNGEIRQITNDLNQKQAESLVNYMKSGEFGMEGAIITVNKNK